MNFLVTQPIGDVFNTPILFTLDTVFLARNFWSSVPYWNRASTRLYYPLPVHTYFDIWNLYCSFGGCKESIALLCLFSALYIIATGMLDSSCAGKQQAAQQPISLLMPHTACDWFRFRR